MPRVVVPAALTLADEYQLLCSTKSDIYEHLPRLAELCVVLDAQHVIELGCRTGVSTVAWLYGLEQTGGRLTSVDIDPAPPLAEWPHWRFVQGDDCDPAVVAQLDTADIVFIDTSHRYEHTLAELHIYRHLVRPGGRIVLHDTELEWPLGVPSRPRFPVRAAVEEFCESERFGWSNNPRCWGLGEIEVT